MSKVFKIMNFLKDPASGLGVVVLNVQSNLKESLCLTNQHQPHDVHFDAQQKTDIDVSSIEHLSIRSLSPLHSLAASVGPFFLDSTRIAPCLFILESKPRLAMQSQARNKTMSIKPEDSKELDCSDPTAANDDIECLTNYSIPSTRSRA